MDNTTLFSVNTTHTTNPSSDRLGINANDNRNHWNDLLEQQWLKAIADPSSPESQALEEESARWEEKQDYYHLRYDRY